MSRSTRARLALAFYVLISIVVAACTSQAPAPTPTPEATAPGAAPGQPYLDGRTWNPGIDMQPVVVSFLAGMPDAWGLLPPQAFASKQVFLVDVRQPEEYQQGFIEGAINIPLRELTRSLSALPPQDQEIALVCDSGSRAAIAMTTLQMLGWKNARSIYNGMNGWEEASLPVVTQPVPERPKHREPAVDANLLAALDAYLTRGLAQDYGLIEPAKLSSDMKLTPFEELVDPEVWAQGPPFVIDVSEPAEYEKGTVGDAINMPLRTIPDSLDMIPWSTPTVVVCGIENHLTTLNRTYKYIVLTCPNGHRAAVSGMVFQLLGFRDVHTLEGGKKAWQAAGES